MTTTCQRTLLRHYAIVGTVLAAFFSALVLGYHQASVGHFVMVFVLTALVLAFGYLLERSSSAPARTTSAVRV